MADRWELSNDPESLRRHIGTEQWNLAIEDVHAGDGTGLRGIERFTPVWVFDEPWSPYRVMAEVEATDRGPRCVQLHLVVKSGGEAITPAGLRSVPLGRIIRMVEEALPATVTLDADGNVRTRDPEEERRLRANYRRATTRRRNEARRWVLDDETLRQVAEVYRDALTAGKPPTAAVEAWFGLNTRGQAARWVKRAREEGHLGAAPGRRLKGDIHQGGEA